MTLPEIQEPRSLAQLQDRIRGRARALGRGEGILDRLIANVIVGQMLPPGVMKGGTALKVRVGEEGSRFSRDLDAARKAGTDLDSYLGVFDENLRTGWEGFTGTIRDGRAVKAPPTVPADYVMRPFKVALSYKGSRWVTIDFELGRDEVGSAVDPDWRIAPDIVALFASVGLPEPAPIPLLPVDHQIAQKLHACTSGGATGGNDRAHDLVDLQILVREERPDLAAVGVTARRLFASRRAQPWPPTVVAFDGWPSIYAEAATDLDVLETVEEAIAWANNDLTANM